MKITSFLKTIALMVCVTFTTTTLANTAPAVAQEVDYRPKTIDQRLKANDQGLLSMVFGLRSDFARDLAAEPLSQVIENLQKIYDGISDPAQKASAKKQIAELIGVVGEDGLTVRQRHLQESGIVQDDAAYETPRFAGEQIVADVLKKDTPISAASLKAAWDANDARATELHLNFTKAQVQSLLDAAEIDDFGNILLKSASHDTDISGKPWHETRNVCMPLDENGFSFDRLYSNAYAFNPEASRHILAETDLAGKKWRITSNNTPLLPYHSLLTPAENRANIVAENDLAAAEALLTQLNDSQATILHSSLLGGCGVNSLHFHLHFFDFPIFSHPALYRNGSGFETRVFTNGPRVSDAWAYIASLQKSNQPYDVMMQKDRIIIMARPADDQFSFGATELAGVIYWGKDRTWDMVKRERGMGIQSSSGNGKGKTTIGRTLLSLILTFVLIPVARGWAVDDPVSVGSSFGLAPLFVLFLIAVVVAGKIIFGSNAPTSLEELDALIAQDREELRMAFGAPVEQVQRPMESRADGGDGGLPTFTDADYRAAAEKAIRDNDPKHMEVFIEDLVRQMGGSVVNRAALQGFAPWYWREAGVRSLTEMKDELRTAQWIRFDGEQVKEVVAVDVASVALSEEGYQQVAAMNDVRAMADFAQRVVVHELGLYLDNGKGSTNAFHGLLQWYIGDKAQSYEKLSFELYFASWVRDDHGVRDKDTIGMRASLTDDRNGEQGYREVASSSMIEMGKYIIRVAESLGKEVSSMPGFVGIVPWYSGDACEPQSLARLKEELRTASWLVDVAKADRKDAESYIHIHVTQEMRDLAGDPRTLLTLEAAVAELRELFHWPNTYEDVYLSIDFCKLGVHRYAHRETFINPIAVKNKFVLKATLLHEHVHYLLGKKYDEATSDAIAGLIETRFLVAECWSYDQANGLFPGTTLKNVITFLREEGAVTAPLRHMLNGFVRHDGVFADKHAAVVKQFCELAYDAKITQSAAELASLVTEVEQGLFKVADFDARIVAQREALLQSAAQDIAEAYAADRTPFGILVDIDSSLDKDLVRMAREKGVRMFVRNGETLSEVGVADSDMTVRSLAYAVDLLRGMDLDVRVLSTQKKELVHVVPEDGVMLFSMQHAEYTLRGKEYATGLLFSAALPYVLLDKKTLEEKYEGVNRPWMKRSALLYEFNIEHVSTYGLNITAAMTHVLEKIKSAITQVVTTRAIESAA